MNLYKKIANAHYEEVGAHTTRSFSRHGLGKVFAAAKRLANRRAKRKEARLDLREKE